MDNNNNIIGIEGVYSYRLDDLFQEENLNNRQLYLNGEIDEKVIDEIVYHILRYNRMDKEKDLSEDERQPIFLYINSPGGDFVSGFSIIDAILSSKTPVYTVNIGAAFSMALLVFIAGSKRYALPHSQFLLHDGSIVCYGTTAKLKDRMDFETIQLEKMVKEFVLSRTEINYALYNTKYKDEWYFLPSEGKSLGVVDYIIGEKDCDIDEVI